MTAEHARAAQSTNSTLLHSSVRLFGKYFLLERLGGGGFGEVFKARVFGMDGYRQLVAVKILRADGVERSLGEHSFEVEMRLARTLHHPNIVPVLDSGRTLARSYLVMPYIAGVTLTMILTSLSTERRYLDLGTVCQVAGSIALALEHAHAGGFTRTRAIVHCDICPSNILIGSDGQVCLIDFGIAATIGAESGRFSGRPRYASPEHLRSCPADPSWDIYALGVVIFEMLTGARAFPQMPLRKLCALKSSSPLHLPSDGDKLGPVPDLVQRCTSLTPSARPTAGEIAATLMPLAAAKSSSLARLAMLTLARSAASTAPFVSDRADPMGDKGVTVRDGPASLALEPRLAAAVETMSEALELSDRNWG